LSKLNRGTKAIFALNYRTASPKPVGMAPGALHRQL